MELDVWCLGPGSSLELGVWNLELFASALSFSKIKMRPKGTFTAGFLRHQFIKIFCAQIVNLR
jgi:hypothetical protein